MIRSLSQKAAGLMGRSQGAPVSPLDTTSQPLSMYVEDGHATRQKKATAAGGVHSHRQAILNHHKQERERMERAVSFAFSVHDNDGNGRLDRDEVRQVLKHLEGNGHEPTDEALDAVMKAAGEAAEIEGDLDCDPAPDGAMMITKDRLMRAVKKYRAYQENQALINAIYQRFDQDSSDNLNREQLVAMLEWIAENPDQMREDIGMGQSPFAGVSWHLEQGELDKAILEVLNEADVDGDGQIGRDEVITAIGIWLRLIYQMRHDEWRRQIAIKRAKQKQCCVVS